MGESETYGRAGTVAGVMALRGSRMQGTAGGMAWDRGRDPVSMVETV